MQYDQQTILQAQSILKGVAQEVFFHKLAGYGIQPENDQQAAEMLQLASSLATSYPRETVQGQQVKSACIDTFGQSYFTDGCSAYAHEAADALCSDQHIMKSAQILLSLQNI